MEKQKILFCYDHKDRIWLHRIQSLLKPLVRKNYIDTWSDEETSIGANRETEFKEKLMSANIAVLLVSSNLLGSDDIVERQLRPLLARREHGYIKTIWIPIGDCLTENTELESIPKAWNKQPISQLPENEQPQALAEVARFIRSSLQMSKKAFDLNENFYHAVNKVRAELAIIPDFFASLQHEHWDNFEKLLLSLSTPEQRAIQRLNTEHYLTKWNLTASLLKNQLQLLGVYDSEINDILPEDVFDAIARFQRKHNLRHIDGVFGPLTYCEMEKVLRIRARLES